MSELPTFNPGTEFARPPWTADQVASLNGYQQSGVMHEFTCGNSDCRRVSGKPLTAAEDGWQCLRCGYTQNWAHPWMADWSWQRGLPLRNLSGFAGSGHGGPGTGNGLRDLPLEPLGARWEVISDHTLELNVEWPPECRCVLLDGEQVSLGGPCPVHAEA